MNLVTEHLTIRELRMEDLEQFDRLGNSDFVLQYLCMFKMDREGFPKLSATDDCQPKGLCHCQQRG